MHRLGFFDFRLGRIGKLLRVSSPAECKRQKEKGEPHDLPPRFRFSFASLSALICDGALLCGGLLSLFDFSLARSRTAARCFVQYLTEFLSSGLGQMEHLPAAMLRCAYVKAATRWASPGSSERKTSFI